MAGGEVEAAPFDFFDLGRTTRIKDPTGARVNLWPPRGHRGFVRANEPGTPIWNELLTPDIGRATRFYCDVFGLSAEESAVAWGSTTASTTLSAAGRRIAGAVPLMEGAPPSWNVYFNVVDVQESVARRGSRRHARHPAL